MTEDIKLRSCVASAAEKMERRMRDFDGVKHMGPADTPEALLSRAADRAYLAKVTPDKQRVYAIDALNLTAIALWVMDHGVTDDGVNLPACGGVVTDEALEAFRRDMAEDEEVVIPVDHDSADKASAERAGEESWRGQLQRAIAATDAVRQQIAQRKAGTARSYADEAVALVTGPRQEDYSHPLEDFTRTAAFWSQILGIEVKPEQVALCMVGLKLSRETHKPKRDNIVDVIGYLLCYEMVLEEANHA